jgi:hypothetical protein
MSGRGRSGSIGGLGAGLGRRPWAIALVALWLGFSGAITALYAGFVPLLPPVVDRPEPAISTALGVLGILAAVGVWQIRDWGRWLGLGLTFVMIVRDLALAIAPDGSGTELAVVMGIMLDVLVLGVLLVRWPPRRT